MVKTYAPRARTPVLDEWQTRDHLSVMGGVTPTGKVYTLVRPTSLNGLHTIEFLLHLGRLAGDRLLVIWDGSPIHRRAEVSEFVAETRGAVRVERLPSYAPDLNPVEWLWRHLKEVELRNLYVPGPGAVAPGVPPGPGPGATEASPRCDPSSRGPNWPFET